MSSVDWMLGLHVRKQELMLHNDPCNGCLSGCIGAILHHFDGTLSRMIVDVVMGAALDKIAQSHCCCCHKCSSVTSLLSLVVVIVLHVALRRET